MGDYFGSQIQRLRFLEASLYFAFSHSRIVFSVFIQNYQRRLPLSFHMCICHLHIFFGKRSVKVFGLFLIRLFAFLLLSFKGYLCNLN